MTYTQLLRSTILCLTISLAASAQADTRKFTGYVGGGPTFPINHLGTYLENGYNILIGGGYRATPAIELLGEFSIQETGVEESVLDSLTVPDGNADFYSLTGNVKFNFIPEGRVNVYAIAGAGWYRRTVQFTEPTTRVITIVDPWWGYVGQVVVPANVVLESVTRDSGGFNIGGGLEFRLGEGVRIFAESRWHRAYHNPTNSTLVPLTFGIRF